MHKYPIYDVFIDNVKDIYKRLTFQSEALIVIITVKRALPGDYVAAVHCRSIVVLLRDALRRADRLAVSRTLIALTGLISHDYRSGDSVVPS